MKNSNGNIRQLITADGTHMRGTLSSPNTGIQVIQDQAWEKYTTSLAIISQGFVRYLKRSDNSYMVASIGKAFDSVKSLLKKVGVGT